MSSGKCPDILRGMDQQSVDWSKLSKKERKALAKEQKRQRSEEEKKRANIGKWVGIGIVAFVIVVGVVWLTSSVTKESSKPLPGKEVPLLGRNHVAVGKKVKYNSNPPTSGDHYATWAKSGVYDRAVEDEYLVHSLEHGYIIISHNCEMTSSKFKVQIAKLGTESAGMVKSCMDFVNKLKERVEKDSWKFILVPRPTLDTNFALTAWGRIDKFNIGEANMDRVNNFVSAFRNSGPEKTME